MITFTPAPINLEKKTFILSVLFYSDISSSVEQTGSDQYFIFYVHSTQLFKTLLLTLAYLIHRGCVLINIKQ